MVAGALRRRGPSRLAAMLVATVLSGCIGSHGESAVPGTFAGSSGSGAEAEPGFITGIVVDPELVPIEGAAVAVTPGDLVVLTDGGGAFKVGPLDDGAYTLVAEKPGYASTSTQVRVNGDVAARVKISLEPVASTVPYHETLIRTMYLICAVSIAAIPPGVQTTVPCAGLVDIALQTATGQPHPNTLDNWTFDFKIDKTGFKSLVMEMVWPPQQFGTNGLLQLSTLATAEAGNGVTVGGTVYGGAMAQPYHGVIHAGRSYWVSGGKNVTFYPEENATQAFEMLVAGYYGNTTVPLGGSAVFINFKPTVYLTFFYNRLAQDQFTILPDR